MRGYTVVTKSQIEEKYKSLQRVLNYEKRFACPIWGMVSNKEIAIVKRYLKRICPEKLLEIAPGTARVSRNIPKHYFGKGYAVDSSPNMLEIARKMLDPGIWEVRLGDAFHLDFPDEYFEAVMTFRFIRHFQTCDRKKIFAQISRVLKPGGYLIFEAFHVNMERIAYKTIGLGGEKGIYDELWSKEELRDELRRAGFRTVALEKLANNIALYYFIEKFRYRWRRATDTDMLFFCRTIFRALDVIPSAHNCYFEVICQKT